MIWKKAFTKRTQRYGKLEWHQDSPVAQRLVVNWISWYWILAPRTHPLPYFETRLKYIFIWSFCIKSFFSPGPFVCLQIKKVLSMFGFGFKFVLFPDVKNFDVRKLNKFEPESEHRSNFSDLEADKWAKAEETFNTERSNKNIFQPLFKLRQGIGVGCQNSIPSNPVHYQPLGQWTVLMSL